MLLSKFGILAKKKLTGTDWWCIDKTVAYFINSKCFREISHMEYTDYKVGGNLRIDNSSKAGLTLIAAAAGYCLSYPWQYTFWGGLVNSGFGAAMVGGLADWYAVTALFRQPLNIPYRTAIIPKNRDRIFKAIITMVEEEIVTATNIKDTLARVGIGRVLINYAGRPDVRQRLEVLADSLVREAALGINAATLSAVLDRLLTAHKDKVRLASLAGQALEWSLENGFADKFINFIIDEVKRLVGEPYMTKLIAGMYSDALKAYAGRQNQRKLVSWILRELLNLDPVSVAGIIQKKTVALLEEMYVPDHLLRNRLRDWLAGFADELKIDSALAERVEAELRPLVVKMVGNLAEIPASQPDLAASGIKWTVRQAVKLADNLVADANRQAWLDNYLAERLAGWVDKNHGEIGRIVSDYLDNFSDDELVTYIEAKVMNDLQMIRINGSVVGGLVGMVLFLITYSAGVTP